MLRGMTKDPDFDASGNGSTREDWNRSSCEMLSSKSSTCKGGRRKQSKPVKMLRGDDGDGTKAAGDADDLGLLLDVKEEEEEEMEQQDKGSFTGNDAHRFCPARVLSVRVPEKSSAGLTECFQEESRIVFRRRSDGKMGDGCLERAPHRNSGISSLEAEGRPTSAEGECGAQIPDPCEGMEFKGWSEDIVDSMVNGFSWSKRSGSVVMKSSSESTKTMDAPNSEPQKTTDISNKELQTTMQISNREPLKTSMILDTDVRSREDKCDTYLMKTENNRLTSDSHHRDTATNFESQRGEFRFNAICNADGSQVADTLTDSLQSVVHSPQLVNKSHQMSNSLQSTCELRIADICKTTMEDYCEICQKRFCNKYYLKKHRQDVHGLANSAAEMMRTAHGPNKIGTDDIHAFRFGSYSPAGCSGSVCSSDVKIPLDKALESFSSSSTSTPLLNYLVFSNADVVPPTSLSGSHRERFVFGSSEAKRSDMCQSQFTNALSLLSDCGLHAAPGGIGFLDAYLRLCCRDIGGRLNGKSEWEQDIFKRHDGDSSALLSQSLTDFQTNAFVKFQDNYLAITNARKVAALQSAGMDGSDASCGGIFPRGGKRSFDIFPSTFARKNNDDYASEVMSKLLKAEQFLSSGTDSVKSVSGFASGKVSDRVVCDLCGKEVCNKYFLKTHKTRVHGWQEGASSQPLQDRSSVGLGPFSSTLSYLVDGISSSSKHIAGGSLPTTKTPSRRKLAEETQSTDVFFGNGSQTKDPHNGLRTTEHARAISAADTGTNDCRSTLNPSPYFPIWSNASAIHTPDEADRTQFGQDNRKEAGAAPRITCRLCSKVVSNKHFLRTHMKRRHGINGGKGGDVRLTEFDRHSRPAVESGNSASRIGEDQRAAETKASKTCSWSSSADKPTNDDDEKNCVNHDDVGLRVVGQGFRKRNPDENRGVVTCPRDEEWEKSASESDVCRSIPVRSCSVARNQTGNSDRREQTLLPSGITDDSMRVQVPQRDTVVSDRERGESKMRLSPDSDMLSTDTHDLKPRSSSICSSREGQNDLDRIRCFLCRKRFRSSVQFNIHVRKVHASVLPSVSCGNRDPAGKAEVDDRRSEPKPRGGIQRPASDTVLERGGKSEGSLPFRVESPIGGKGRGVGARSSMQPFLLREVTGLDLFCPSVVYLPSLRTMTNPTAVTFTLTPMIQEELGQFT